MIDEIQVSNLALIRKASLVLSSGLTVLTGETGAGKTALLSALKLLLGARADRTMIREGSNELIVSGRFLGVPRSEEDAFKQHSNPKGSDPKDSNLAGSDPKDSDLAGNDLADSADKERGELSPSQEVVVTRRVGTDGRSRATINGMMASMRELAGVVAPTVDLCGQFEYQQLMSTATHVKLLDAWAGSDVVKARTAYEAAFEAAKDAKEKLERLLATQASSTAQVDEARFVLRRIDAVNPEPGEYDELIHDLTLAEHAEGLVESTYGAHAALAGDGGVLDKLNEAASALETVKNLDGTLGSLADSLREAGYIIEDVAREVRVYRDRVEFDPETLMQQQERVAAFQGLMRDYGPRMEDVFARRDQAIRVVELVDDGEEHLEAARRAVKDAEETLAFAAAELHKARSKAAPRFAAEVTKTMARLEMGTAEFVCVFEPLDRSDWTMTGPHQMEFRYCPSKGMQARPLTRIASGGEMSRVMLAIKVALGATDEVDTLVFDEVDAGVGGATAVALAEVIADLAKTHQVIVVTHLAQIAVYGDVHYVVTRADECPADTEDETEDDGPVAYTVLQHVEGKARIDEIARMLSGTVTDASCAHAREMLQEAGG